MYDVGFALRTRTNAHKGIAKTVKDVLQIRKKRNEKQENQNENVEERTATQSSSSSLLRILDKAHLSKSNSL